MTCIGQTRSELFYKTLVSIWEFFELQVFFDAYASLQWQKMILAVYKGKTGKRKSSSAFPRQQKC